MHVESAGVVGLGTMGAGIAEVLARAGLGVVAVEVDDRLLETGRGRVTGSLQRSLDKGRLEPAEHAAVLSRLSFSTDRADLAGVDLVVEAVPERLDAKVGLFSELDAMCPAGTVFATNTSSLSVTAIAAATGRPGRVVGLHFFNPAPVMRLVEVVHTVLAEPDAVEAVRSVAERAGKTPVLVGDRAGFIANALLLPYLNDAARAVETGRGSVEAVDRAMAELAGLPMGPLTLMDLIGLDVCVPIMDVLWEEFREIRYATSPLLRRLAVAGQLGRKSSRGWYSYDGAEPVPATGVTKDEPYDATPLLVRHLADAIRMVADGYASEADVDTAMRLGCGYPQGPFALLAAAPAGVADAARELAGHLGR